jgi:membrane-bound metal-dependent hydrolase YbcI (DUF457 family)
MALLALSVAACLTLAIFATDMVEQRIAANIERASRTRKLGKRRLMIFNWPKSSLKQGTRFWGLASLLLALQIGVDTVSPYLSLPNTYDIFAWGGLAVIALAAFHTTLILEFIMNPNYKPRITLGLIFLALCICIVDACTASLFSWTYPSFWFTNLFGKLFILLLPLSIFFSAAFWWAIYREKTGIGFVLISAALSAPYLVLMVLLVLVVVRVHLS